MSEKIGQLKMKANDVSLQSSSQNLIILCVSEHFRPANPEAQKPAENLLLPGTIIQFSDITELHTFEDVIAEQVDLNYKKDFWVARPKLRDLIRPPKFNGTITNIKLEVMDEPYERLLDARERGWKIGKRGGSELSGESAQARIEKFKGFTLTADAKSSGRGIIGQIQAELFYYPINRYGLDDQYGRGVNRVVTKPKIETESFRELNESSRRIGFTELRQAMQKPLPTPMRY